jgi:8-oxo-dGTP pyrophosphatase MutT (NUDIX family)
MTTQPEPRAASTVVLLRDGPAGLETLMLRRNKALMFAGGLWVFPGGALEPSDLAAADDDLLLASRIAAAREAYEESGLKPALEEMVLVSHWTTPVAEPKRFSTWIYAAPVERDCEVVIDGGEIHDHLWIGLGEALAMHERGEMGMLPPTYITLRTLASYADVAELVHAERDSGVPEVLPIMVQEQGKPAVLFRGDAGYESGEPAMPGARHRAVLAGQRWIYSHVDVEPAFPSLVRL